MNTVQFIVLVGAIYTGCHSQYFFIKNMRIPCIFRDFMTKIKKHQQILHMNTNITYIDTILHDNPIIMVTFINN